MRPKMAASRLLLVLVLGIGIGGILASEGGSSHHPLGVFFERAPESAVAPRDDEVVFECELNLRPDRLEWRFRPSGSTEPYRYLRPSAGYNVTSGNEDRAWRLRIYVGPQTVGDYQCVAWFGPGALASTPARLSLVTLALDTSAGAGSRAGTIRWSVAPKNCILIRCGNVVSNPPAIWSFFRNGEKLPQVGQPAGAAGALVLDQVTAKDAGNYSCSATNAITGQKLDLPQKIELRVDYTERTPPYFLRRPPTDMSARPGETVVLECPGVGSPRPKAIWSSPNVGLDQNRTKVLGYGLQISDVRAEDQGSYVCRLDNGHEPLVHIIKLSVLQRPLILRGPAETLTKEGDRVVLECSATGNPQPEIYWLLNGEEAKNDAEAHVDNRSLQLQRVQKRHAGVVQCFARNVLGEISEGNMLRVSPLPITGEENPLPARPLHESSSSSSLAPSSGNRNKGKRKYMRGSAYLVPSRPNVTRLSDDSVMLRWSVPQTGGSLAIDFFKVQYRMLGDLTGKVPRDAWQTTSEVIPYNYGAASPLKRPRARERLHDPQEPRNQHESGGGPKNFTVSVTGLVAERFYRFRIFAVYSNNDNKEGNTSLKFFLQKGVARSQLPVPELRDVESLSESSALLRWALGPGTQSQVDGYFAYYRPVESAAEYLKATVDGGGSRSFRIDLLRPGTAYEFKLQSFNADAASEFSAIRQARTKKPNEPGVAAAPTTPVSVQQQNSIYPVIAGAAGGGLLLLVATIVVCFCLKRKNAQPEDENKPQLEHIQADFVTSAVLGHHKSGDVRRLNGVIPRMNITPNPLAQETAADKATVGLHQNGLHHAQPYHPPGTPTLMHKRLDYQQHQQPPPVPPHSAYYQQAPTSHNHNHNHHPNHQPSPMLERSVRSLQQQQQHQQHQQQQQAGGYHLEEGTPTPSRIPSLRRQRRTSGSQHNSHSNLNLNLSLGHHNNNNNNLPPHHQHLHHHHPGHPGGLVGIPIVPGSPRVQRSPMPSRAMIKRTRLGSHTDNISSGSLNSIEV